MSLKTLIEWTKGRDPIYPPAISSPAAIESTEKLLGKGLIPDVPFNGTLVGIEVEVEGVPALCTEPPRKQFFWWKAKKDGTLRDNGIELISPPLSSAEAVGAALVELQCGLKSLRGYKFSWRTSIHVHMSALHFNIMDMASFFLVYPVVEPILFEVFSPERKNSVFCVPFIETKMKWDAVSRVLKEAHGKKAESFNFVDFIQSTWRSDQNKYGAVNFSRLGDLGTIEFRHLAGTDDFEKLVSWISCLTRLVTFCNQNSIEVIKKLLWSLVEPTKRKPFLKALFGVKESEEMLKHANLLENGLKKTVLLMDLVPKKNLMKVSSKGGFVQKVEKIKAKKLERAKRRIVTL